jgi:hypothetical protein
MRDVMRVMEQGLKVLQFLAGGEESELCKQANVAAVLDTVARFRAIDTPPVSPKTS